MTIQTALLLAAVVTLVLNVLVGDKLKVKLWMPVALLVAAECLDKFAAK